MSNGCNASYCDTGLSCDATNTCVIDNGNEPPPPAPSCSMLLVESTCPDGLEPECVGPWAVSPQWTGACAMTAQDDGGDTFLCCDTTKPFCIAEGPSCSGASAGYACNGDAPPPVGDASLECTAIAAAGSFAMYCCAGSNDCVEDPEAFADCGVGAQGFLCTGSAVPESTTPCTPALTNEPGDLPALGRAYCCVDVAADGGAD